MELCWMASLGICVPTFNSARYLDLALEYYSDIAVPVTVFVDTKSTDHTLSIARSSGFEVQLIENKTTRVSEMLGEMSRHVGTDWVLRIDDDELPTRRMIEFAQAIARTGSPAQDFGFLRFQCAVNRNGAPLYHLDYPPEDHRQYRLYRPAGLVFTGLGHTCGFEQHNIVNDKAPDDAFMIHLDWVVHTKAERLEKIARYDAHTPNHGSMWHDYYLADQQSNYVERLAPLRCDDFLKVGRRLADRFGSISSDWGRPSWWPRHSRIGG
jgi:glycosyltransferase involved in cell wall biosynthesis